MVNRNTVVILFIYLVVQILDEHIKIKLVENPKNNKLKTLYLLECKVVNGKFDG